MNEMARPTKNVGFLINPSRLKHRQRKCPITKSNREIRGFSFGSISVSEDIVFCYISLSLDFHARYSIELPTIEKCKIFNGEINVQGARKDL